MLNVNNPTIQSLNQYGYEVTIEPWGNYSSVDISNSSIRIILIATNDRYITWSIYPQNDRGEALTRYLYDNLTITFKSFDDGIDQIERTLCQPYNSIIGNLAHRHIGIDEIRKIHLDPIIYINGQCGPIHSEYARSLV